MEFPATEWSLLAQATLNGEAAAARALEEFCRRYRAPVLQFVRNRGVPPAEAEDLTQDFLLHLMEKSALRRADAARGRFRSFLIGSLVRFLRDARQRETAQKRGGTEKALSFDESELAAVLPTIAPEDAATFDRAWALQLLELAIEAVRADYAQAGKTEAHAVLAAYLPGRGAPPPYEQSAAKLGLPLATFKTEVHRLRERFRSRLRREVAATVTSPDEVDAELAYLGRVLQGAAA